MPYILSLDEGTTNAKAFIISEEGKIISSASREFSQYYPRPGWVEHNPEEIWNAQILAAREAIKRAKLEPGDIAAIGITNQRETTIIWDRNGKPVYNAIVWQCRRTAEFMERVKKEYGDLIREKTGLIGDAYFSASKIRWILDNVQGARERAKKGELMFGTVDSYLIYKLTGKHATDYSNASRTMLFNIKRGQWDDELLEIFKIPEEILPEVLNSADDYGHAKEFLGNVPVSGVLGDQQAALFGQACFREGMLKVTYGTGNFLLINTGESLPNSRNLLSTIAWKIGNKMNYALEGSIFITGAALKWIRDLGLIESYEETEELARSLGSNEDLYFVPAFSGLGSPYWDPYARGIIIGITRGTRKKHIVRATLEAIAYLTRDVVEEIKRHIFVRELRVDGGASINNFLMQFQADILGVPLLRPVNRESTSMGVAFMAGLQEDVWDMQTLEKLWEVDRKFVPKMDEAEREKLYARWKRAVSRSLGWVID